MTTPVPFGGYLLVERVAIGGMAEVYAAIDAAGPHGRRCAVKRMLPTLAEDRELVGMFLDEARLAAQLDHPGIVPVLDLGKLGSRYFLAMDWVAGQDLGALAARLRRRGERLPVDLAALVALRLADALDHAHRGRAADGRELRIVHRDVSPANVLVGFGGTVRLIDFGIAQVARRAPPRAAALRGKLGYMSPEMVRGLPVDRRSDVFALGVVLHELLTGERLFTGPTELATMEKVRAAEAAPPSASNPAVPPELDRVVLRALAREPEGRFAWASELRDALGAFAPDAARPGGATALAGLMAEAFPDGLRAEEERWARARAALERASS